MKINENDNFKYKFGIWLYYGKFDFKSNRKKIIKESILDEYAFFIK